MKRERNRSLLILTGTALVCCVLAFSVIVSLYVNRFTKTIEEENRIRMAETAASVGTYMKSIISSMQQSLVNASEAVVLLPEEEKLQYLERVAKQSDLVYVGYAGPDGKLLATIPSKTADISAQDYFIKAMKGENAIGGIGREIFMDKAVTGIKISVPLPQTGGVLVGMMALKRLEAALEMENFGGKGYSYVINAEGDLVVYKKSMDYYNYFSVLESVTFQDKFSLDMLLDDVKNQRAGLTGYSNFGSEQYAYYCPIGVNDWMVVNIVSKEVITAHTDALANELILLCVCALVLLVVLLMVAFFLLNQSQSRKRANEAKSAFLANMSHDIRTPMNAIMGMTAIAAAHIEEPQRVQQCLEKIAISGKHLLGLINDVLDMSKIESGKMTLNNNVAYLPEIIDDMVSISQPSIKSRRQNFSIRLHNVEHEKLCCDSLRLAQVFINLLSNAVKFTPVGGSISVDVEELKSQKPGMGSYRFVFADTGMGMKTEFLRDIFTVFTRERDSKLDKIEGSGLGMAITKKIIDEMGGTIGVKSEEGKGSTFTIEVDLQLDRKEPETMELPPLRILVADDDEESCQSVAAALNEMGADAVWVNNGAAAVEQLMEAKVQQKDFNAAILDWRMPDMDGLATAERIKEKVGPDIPILIFSAYDWEDIKGKAMDIGITGFIQKPLFKSKLFYCVQEFVCGNKDVRKQDNEEDDYSLIGHNILLVEDNELNSEIATELLSVRGAVVETACNGEEGVSMFKKAEAGYYSLIFMDIQMPVMNGYEAAKAIRSLNRADAADVPIIAMTADAFAEDIAHAKLAGMNSHLAKPLDMVVLMREIRKYIMPE